MNRIVLFLFLAVYSVSADENAGMAFLKISVDARAAAMGNAAGAVMTDAAAGFWNPAGIALAEQQTLVLTHNVWLQGVDHEFGAIQLMRGENNLAASINMVNIPGIEIRGNSPTDRPEAVTSAHNLYVAMNYARPISENVFVGAQIKYLYEKYYLASATGFALDLGVTHIGIVKDVDAAFSILNIGTMEKLNEVSTKLPITTRLSAAWHLPFAFEARKTLLAADLLLITGSNAKMNIGIELPVWQLLAIRAGYIIGTESTNWSVGAGLKYSAYQIDYAYVPFDFDLGDSHRFTLRFEL